MSIKLRGGGSKLNAPKSKKNRRVKITNQIVIFQAVVATLFIIIFFIMGLPKLTVPLFIIVAGFIVASILNQKNVQVPAQFIMILCSNFGIFYFASVLGKACGVQMVYFAVAWFPLIIFDIKNKRNIVLGISITILCYLWLELTQYNAFTTIQLSEKTQYILYIFYAATTFIINMAGIFIFYFSSLTAEKKLANALYDVKESNKKLQLAYNRLKESREAQVLLTQHAEYAKLVQSIAHEFKNPLQMLQGTAEVGLLKDEKNKDIFNTIINSVERLNNVIQPLLLYLNKKTAYTFAPFSMVTIIEEIMILSKANCKAKKIQLSFDNQSISDHVNGDAQFIGQVVINLITNAIEAISDDGGTISIQLTDDTVSQHNESVNAVRMDIKDSGCGIPEEKINAIFMPYETVRHSESNVGLGLSIVSKIIKDHHGLIKITSEAGQGTNVTVWLPVSNQKILDNESQIKLFELDDAFFEAS